MSEIRDRLTKLRQQEQETRGYGTSSAWYTALRPAISYLELAEAATNPAEKFRNAWNAVYNLSMMMHRRGEIENVTFTHLITEVEAAPKVRSIALATPTAFLEALKKAQTTLLFDAESKKPRESKQLVEIWLDRRKKRGDISPEKACTYLFLIGRDLRNALSHPKLDPNSPIIKRALAQAADIFVPLAIATTEAIIERPPEGTTGRVIAYRSFLYPFLKNSDSPFSDYYLERLFPEQELSAFPEAEGKASLKEINQELEARRKELVRADAVETLQRWCVPVLFQKLGLIADCNVKVVAEDGVFEPTAVIKKADLRGEPRAEYKGKDAGRDLACLIWVLPWSVSLDAVSRDEQFESLTMLEVAQRALRRADVDWAILTNGQQVRLLSKTTSHKARSFMEIDLVAIVERRVEREAQLAFRYLLGLCSQASIVESDTQGHTRLERALRESERHGREISEELKKNVFNALEELGAGFLAYMQSQQDEMDAWRLHRAPSLSAQEFLASQELLTDIYQESLSLMYRLLFLFYAEGRDLLPMDEELYRDTYSLESIRDDIITTHDDPDPTSFFSKGVFNLWGRLTELFHAVDGGWRDIIPTYNGGLFDPEQHELLERFKINDYHLARAIDFLSRTRPGVAKGEGRKKVTYRDLDIRHLGRIYEGILEYHANIADQEKAIVKRGTGGKAAEEYVSLSDLTPDERKHLKAYREALTEDDENPTPPRGCKVSGLIAPGEYYLIYGGRESKRKSSGSYYTPDYIVQYIVENTLGPLVRGECRPKPAPVPELLKGERGFEEDAEEVRPLTSDEILDLKVLDPAMGSGHFLVAATEYLARAYGTACIRKGKDKDGVMSDDEFVHYKRIVAERCIYGVDINPMAVELSKLSMWLFTMDKGRPLSFLNHHLKWGNTLVGTLIQDLGTPPEPNGLGGAKKRSRRDAKTGNLFEVRFRAKVPLMVRDLLGIMGQETLTPNDIQLKKSLDKAVEKIRQPFRNLANIWIGLHFGEEADDYNSLLLHIEQADQRFVDSTEKYRPFHYELEFPEVWFDATGGTLSKKGFSAVIGNPPYLAFHEGSQRLKEYYKVRFSTASGKYDQYILFAEQTLKLVSSPGLISLIVPNKFITSQYGAVFKELSLRQSSLVSFVDFGDLQVFEESTNYPCIFVLGKPPAEFPQTNFYRVLRSPPMALSQLPLATSTEEVSVISSNSTSPTWSTVTDSTQSILDQLTANGATELRRITTGLFQGVRIGLQEAFHVSAIEIDSEGLEKEIVYPAVGGRDIDAFAAAPSRDNSKPSHLIYPYDLRTGDLVDISRYPNCEKRLRQFYDALLERKDSGRTMRASGKKWYEYWDPCKKMLQRRIVTPDIANHNEFGVVEGSLISLNTVYSVVIAEKAISYECLAVLLNSSIVEFFIHSISPSVRGAYYRYKTKYLERIPIPSYLVSTEKETEWDGEISSYSSDERDLYDECLEFAKSRNRLNSLSLLQTLYHDRIRLGEQMDSLLNSAVAGFYQVGPYRSLRELV